MTHNYITCFSFDRCIVRP